jgi:hypothetical protein
MGGSASWGSVTDTKVIGSCAYPASAPANAKTYSVLWITQGNEYRYVTDSADLGAAVYLSGHGGPKVLLSSGEQRLPYEYGLRRLSFHLPGLVLAPTLNGSETFSLMLLGTESIAGIETVHVRSMEYRGSSNVQGSEQDWWFDTAHGFPVQVTYNLPSEDNSHYDHLTTVFSQWQSASNITVPFQQSTVLEGQIVIQDCQLQKIEINTNPASTIFDAL